ncbi:MAG TPA: MopE-related protein [Myxococcota bacterium]|nr:MopE-related protein [Myxococcota bacterium]HOC99339.1 MopE-related protein [Myxococcota bacterium]HPV03311.1 MopE-related protein [Myxococcota bacterium]
MKRFTSIVLPSVFFCMLLASCEGSDPRKIGEFCESEADCESGLCYDSQCLNPDGDFDLDGIKNGIERNITGTSYGLADTDGDGINDGTEVGNDVNSPLDGDGDGIIDALESRLPTADPDGDCLPDEFDAQNNEFSENPAKVAELNCSRAGVCGLAFDKVTATCAQGVAACDYSQVPSFEETEATCDGLDNDCDGKADIGLQPPSQPACSHKGICAGRQEVIFRVCLRGEWVCEYSGITGWEPNESSCDSIDNNCDGETDEGLVGQDCFNRNEYGKCAGTTACNEFKGVTCIGQTPAAEICNGIDDNCNGSTDEDLVGIECEIVNEFGTCTGETVCDIQTGGADCDAMTPAQEICDTIDNDCDGMTDEDFICDRTSTIMMKVFGASLPPPPFKSSATGEGYQALSGASVSFYKDSCPPETELSAAWTVTTDDEGKSEIPIEPGLWCIQVSAEGYQAMTTDVLFLEPGTVIPIEMILLLNGMTQAQLSMCGRVLEYDDYVVTTSGSTEPASGSPVPAALITLVDMTGSTEIATTTSDSNGYWCLVGLPQLPAEPYLMLNSVKDGFYPASYEAMISMNALTFSTIMMSRLPSEEGSCLFDGFEDSGRVGMWTITQGETSPVTWNIQSSQVCVAPVYLNECLPVPANEADISAEGTLLCQEEGIYDDGCIPSPGSLAGAGGGDFYAWFGNPLTCSYSESGENCEFVGKRVSGALESPWINGIDAWTLYLMFDSAWEIESQTSSVDVMYVEAQTSPQSETGLWTLVGTVNTMTPLDTAQVTRAAAAGGWTSGGDASGPTWNTYKLDLKDFAGEFFRIRFRFDSMDGNANLYRGWQIDNISVSGIGCRSNEN